MGVFEEISRNQIKATLQERQKRRQRALKALAECERLKGVFEKLLGTQDQEGLKKLFQDIHNLAFSLGASKVKVESPGQVIGAIRTLRTAAEDLLKETQS